MISLKKNSRFKPIYKTFKILKTVIFNRKVYKNLFIKKFIRNKNKFSDKNISYSNLSFPYEFFFKNYYKSGLITKQKFSYFYGSIKLKSLKNKLVLFKKKLKNFKVTNIFHKNLFFLELFEKRIDSVLYRTYFVLNLKQAKHLILHKHVRINNQLVRNSFLLLRKGDLITFSKSSHSILRKNLLTSLKFEFLPKNLEVNYNTLQISCLDKFKNFLYLNNFNYLDDYKLDYSVNSLFRFLKNY